MQHHAAVLLPPTTAAGMQLLGSATCAVPTHGTRLMQDLTQVMHSTMCLCIPRSDHMPEKHMCQSITASQQPWCTTQSLCPCGMTTCICNKHASTASYCYDVYLYVQHHNRWAKRQSTTSPGVEGVGVGTNPTKSALNRIAHPPLLTPHMLWLGSLRIQASWCSPPMSS
jgi:hypothetical protein